MKELIIATRWEVKAEGNKRSIQLYDDKGNKVEGHLAKWSGGFHCSNNHLTSLEGAPKENSQTVTHRIFEEKLVKGYLYADGILEKIVSRKTKGDIEIFKTRKIGSKKESFVVKRGTTFSHGETIKQALEDLQYKISDRDTTEYKKWTLETQVTKAEMIAAYRKITGACSSGVKSFVESQGEKIKNKMTVAEVIALTRSSYGGNEFERFFK